MTEHVETARPGVMRGMYDWMMRNARGRYAFWILGAVSFAESSFFPLPPDLMLVPMALADRSRAFVLALWCTFTSVLGGILGYFIGLALYDSVGLWLIQLYGAGESVETFRQLYAEWGSWIILIKGLTPIPYKVVTIMSGFSGYDFAMFVALSVLTRFLRFGIVAGLIYYFGPPIRTFIEKRLELTMLGVLAIVLLGLVAARYVV